MIPDSDSTTTIHLEFLTDNDTERQLCIRYWQIDTDGKFIHSTTAVAQGFGVTDAKVSSLVAERCIAFCPDESCGTCGQRRPFRTRMEFQRRQRWRRYASLCTFESCVSCQEAARREAQRQAEELAREASARLHDELRTLRRDYPWCPPRLLSFQDAIYLVSLFRAGGAADLSYVAPHAAFTSSLSPTTEFDQQILEHLYRRKIIGIHPDSSPEAVEFDSSGRLTGFILLKVQWILPTPIDGPSPARYVEDLEHLLKSNDEWPAEWHEEAAELHRTLALQECLAYLQVALQEHGFEHRPGDKLSVALRSVLARFTIGQAYNFIWRAAEKAASFYLRQRVHKAHAVNIVPGNLQRAAERAAVEGWTVGAYRRDRRAPESHVSHALFTMALKLPEGGLGSVPPFLRS
jgi:hypothetical protein